MLDNKLIIDIPKGMEVDIEKSDLKAGIIAFKKRPFSYEDVIITTRSNTVFAGSHDIMLAFLLHWIS